MKLRYLILVVIVGVMFSLGCVSASENMTSDASSVDDAPLAIGNNQDFNSEDIIGEDNSSENEGIDLIVKIDVKSAQQKNQFNRAGFKVPWTITAMVTGGIARNVIINDTLSSNMDYLSHNATMGEFDPVTGIWHIGDLTSYDNASLTILTVLKTDGRFKNTVSATTESQEVNILNNIISSSIKSGSSKVTSNVTETTDDKNEPQHNIHYASENADSNVRQVEEEKTVPESSDSESSDIATKSKTDMKTERFDSGSISSSASSAANDMSLGGSASSAANGVTMLDTITKTTDSVTRDISSTFESLGNSILDIFNPSSDSDDLDSNANSSSSPVKAISAHNYTTIPVLIFALFLIILLPMFAYKKIKS